MLDVLNRRCAGLNLDGSPCEKLNPAFNSPNETQGMFCEEHRETDMINVRAKSCAGKNKDGSPCKTCPVFNKPGQSQGMFCAKHKEDGMINIKNRPCRGKNTDGSPCATYPVFNVQGEKRGLFCAKHKTNDMVDTQNKRCGGTNADGSACMKQPTFNTQGESQALFCLTHKGSAMINVVDKTCKTPHCTTKVSNKAYKGHCYRCFVNLFPDNTIVRRHRTKERAVADYIRAKYPDLTITFDRTVADGCSRRRPDILMDMGEYVIITEIDENQHGDYICTCENKRIMELFQDAGNRPLVMIRFNPDRYYDQRKRPIASCWGHTKEKGLSVVKPGKTAEWEQRLATLKTTLDLVIAQGTEKEIDVYHLFYDGF